MANQRINMQKLKKLIELTISGTSQRAISTILGIHRRAVVNYKGLLNSHTVGDLNIYSVDSHPPTPLQIEPLF